MADKDQRVRVTLTEEFIIPMLDDKITKINGWTVAQVIDDWFGFPMDSYHATRDGWRTGNSRKIVKTELIKES